LAEATIPLVVLADVAQGRGREVIVRIQEVDFWGVTEVYWVVGMNTPIYEIRILLHRHLEQD
jgi:hypothetical protein